MSRLWLWLSLAGCGSLAPDLAKTVDADGDGAVEAVDCNDGDADVFPGQIETCNDRDDNCNDLVDEAPSDGQVLYVDADGDGHGDPDVSVVQCAGREGWVEADDDCDDADRDSYPGADERCDGADNDCDGSVDNDLDIVWYLDSDGDGVGGGTPGCGPNHVPERGDCDDGDAKQFPGADERCNGEDDDCNSVVDDNAIDGVAFFPDTDTDGFGDGSLGAVWACTAPTGHGPAGDCDDARSDVYPHAPEACDGVDHDCDGLTNQADAADAVITYEDGDADGWGDVSTRALGCVAGNRVAQAGDCDDAVGTTHPDAPELCDGDDNDCDGDVDEDGAIDGAVYFVDADTDGFGDDALPLQACAAPSGYAAAGGDCNDADINIAPDADELCDATDHNCDGDATAGAADATVWYLDGDGDGVGSPDYVTVACARPNGTSADGHDCWDRVSGPTLDGDGDCDGVLDGGALMVVSDASGSDELWWSDGAGALERLTFQADDLGAASHPRIAPDGGHVAFVYGGTRLMVLDVADGSLTEWARGTAVSGPVWTDAGLVFTDGGDLWRSDGGAVVHLVADLDGWTELRADDATQTGLLVYAWDGANSGGFYTWDNAADWASTGFGASATHTHSVGRMGPQGDQFAFVAHETGANPAHSTLQVANLGGAAQVVRDVVDPLVWDAPVFDAAGGLVALAGDGTVLGVASGRGAAARIVAEDGVAFTAVDVFWGGLEAQDVDGDGLTTADGDCDDLDADENLAGTEVCDGRDNNCDGSVDEGALCDGLSVEAGAWWSAKAAFQELSVATFFADADGDGIEDAAMVALGAEELYVFSGATMPSLGGFARDDASAVWTCADIASVVGGDIDGDGAVELLVGRPFDGGNGAVHLLADPFAGGDCTTSAAATLTGSGVYPEVGTALTLGGDIDDDGARDVLVGARAMDVDPEPGMVLAFDGATLLANATGADAWATFSGRDSDYLGRALVALDDLDGDGIADFAAGAPAAGSGSGRAYVFAGGTWTGANVTPDDATWTVQPQGTGVHEFGSAMAAPGDMDGDGYADLAVGARYEGCLYLYAGGDSGPVEAVRYCPYGTFSGSNIADYGASVSAVGDGDGDGLPDVLVGAALADDNTTEAGRVFLIGGDVVWAAPVLATWDGQAPNIELGPPTQPGAGGADLDGDGRSEFLVGSARAGGDGGAIYLLGL